MKSKIRFLLAAIMLLAGTTNAGAQSTSQVTDVMNREWTGRSGSSYGDWSGLTLTSDAVYAGLTAGGNNAIQLRSNNQNSGIVTTTSGGTVASVTVTWNSSTPNGRTLEVYGKHSAYSAASDLYGDNAGDLLGSIVYGTSTPLTIEGDYEYIGLRSMSGAMYLNEIQVVWNVAGSATPEPEPEPTTTNYTLTGVPQGWQVQAGNPLDGVVPNADGSYSIAAGQPVLLVPSAEDKPRVKSVTLEDEAPAVQTITIGNITLNITGCTTWQDIIDLNPGVIWEYYGNVASDEGALKLSGNTVHPSDPYDPALQSNYYWQSM